MGMSSFLIFKRGESAPANDLLRDLNKICIEKRMAKREQVVAEKLRKQQLVQEAENAFCCEREWNVLEVKRPQSR